MEGGWGNTPAKVTNALINARVCLVPRRGAGTGAGDTFEGPWGHAKTVLWSWSDNWTHFLRPKLYTQDE